MLGRLYSKLTLEVRFGLISRESSSLPQQNKLWMKSRSEWMRKKKVVFIRNRNLERQWKNNLMEWRSIRTWGRVFDRMKSFKWDGI